MHFLDFKFFIQESLQNPVSSGIFSESGPETNRLWLIGCFKMNMLILKRFFLKWKVNYQMAENGKGGTTTRGEFIVWGKI